MLPETPIEVRDEDIFERDGFAGHLADLLVLDKDQPSLVLALEGKWGTGKTSVINLVKNTIKEKYLNVIIVDFNPWLIGSLDSVVEGLLIQMASSLSQSSNTAAAKKAARNLLNFAKFLAPIKLIPGVEPWGTLVENVLSSVGSSVKAAVDLSELDLSARKETVQNYVSEMDTSIIVFIDDIDRLPPVEIRIIIQVVKAIADFDRVSYLLSYDPDPVIKSLAYEGTYDGARYIEKIVQASYPIPRIGYWHLKSFLRGHLKEMLVRIRRSPNIAEEKLLNKLLDTTALVRSLSTPRDVIRLINRLSVTAKNTWGEVNYADMIAFEVLELKYNKVSNLIRTRPEIFLGTTNIEGDFVFQDGLNETDEPGDSSEVKTYRELIKDLTSIEKRNIDSIIAFLFPEFLGKWEHIAWEDAVLNNRIYTKDALLKLLHSGANRYVFSTKEAKHFLENKDDRKEILIDQLIAGTIAGWLSYLANFTHNSKIEDKFALTESFTDLAKTAFDDLGQNLVDSISMPLMNMLLVSEEIKSLLHSLVSSMDSISLSEHVLLRLLRNFGMWESGVYKGKESGVKEESKDFKLTQDDLIEEKNNWLKTVREKTGKQGYLFLKKEPEPISVLFRWGQLNDNDFSEVQEYLEEVTSTGEGMNAFIECFHEGKGLDGINKLIKNHTDFVERIKSLEKLSRSGKRIISYLNQRMQIETGSDEKATEDLL